MIKDGIVNKAFVSRNDTFTVECLLPGGWVNGRLINFIVDVLQPPERENILLFDTYFWPSRLNLKALGPPLEKLDDPNWKQVLKTSPLKVRISFLFHCLTYALSMYC